MISLSSCVQVLQQVCHAQSAKAGWWTDLATGQPIEISKTLISEKLMLIVTEVAEAMEGNRKDKMDDHLPHRKMIEVELADAVIRIADLAGALNLDLGQAVYEKLQYNQTRKDHSLEARMGANGKKC
jgi:NTP pyrophosphatase (non-canonical NTP hydrolase)